MIEERGNMAEIGSGSGKLAVRRAITAAIDALKKGGDHAGAEALINLAVAQGYWQRPDQRPLHFLPNLPASPVHDTRSSYVARYFERHASQIMAEAHEVIGKQEASLSPVEEALVSNGAWDVAMFYEAGFRNPRVCKLFPETADIIDKAPEDVRKAGVVMFSWLQPGTHILAHCGFSNARLRLHLGLSPDTGARLRVGDQVLSWQEGRCILFDDSFEHEVHHEGNEPRLVLLVDVFHPALQERARQEFLQLSGSNAEKKAQALLSELGARRLVLDSNAGFTVTFEAEQDRRIRRQMREAEIEGMALNSVGDVEFFPVDSS